jgi:predicted dehydrogenase
MYRRMGEAITNGTGTEPDFDQAVKRHRLLDTIQRSSDQGVKQKVS